MNRQLEDGDGSSHSLIPRVDVLLGHLLVPRLLPGEMLLVDPLEVVLHPPLVGLAAAGLPPGDVLLADVTHSQVRAPSCWV